MQLPDSPYFIRQIDRNVKALVLNPRIGHRLRLPQDSTSYYTHILQSPLCLFKASFLSHCVFILNRDSDYEYNERFFRALAVPCSTSMLVIFCILFPSISRQPPLYVIPIFLSLLSKHLHTHAHARARVCVYIFFEKNFCIYI